MNIYTKCKTCTKRSKQSIECLKLSTYQLSNGNINKFILLLKKRCLSIWIHGWLE